MFRIYTYVVYNIYLHTCVISSPSNSYTLRCLWLLCLLLPLHEQCSSAGFFNIIVYRPNYLAEQKIYTASNTDNMNRAAAVLDVCITVALSCEVFDATTQQCSTYNLCNRCPYAAICT
jgi:hypothetical protein